jgi:hypothetical protein
VRSNRLDRALLAAALTVGKNLGVAPSTMLQALSVCSPSSRVTAYARPKGMESFVDNAGPFLRKDVARLSLPPSRLVSIWVYFAGILLGFDCSATARKSPSTPACGANAGPQDKSCMASREIALQGRMAAEVLVDAALAAQSTPRRPKSRPQTRRRPSSQPKR